MNVMLREETFFRTLEVDVKKTGLTDKTVLKLNMIYFLIRRRSVKTFLNFFFTIINFQRMFNGGKIETCGTLNCKILSQFILQLPVSH